MRFDDGIGRYGELAPGYTRSAPPRICMPTWRNFTKRAFRCGLYEAQDVLVQNDNVDLIPLDMTRAGSKSPG
jgi:hypothetical protein